MKKFLLEGIKSLIYILIILLGVLFFHEKVIINSDDSYIDRKYYNIKKKDTLDLIIMGDSRAERGISPTIIDSILDINSINLAVPAGDINRIEKFFTHNQKILKDLKKNKNLKLIISVSEWQVNDNAQNWGILSHSTFSLLSPLDRLIYLNKKIDFLRFVIRGYENYFHKRLRSMGLINLRDKFDSQGFLGVEGTLTEQSVEKIKTDVHPWYINDKIDGWRFELYVNTLKFLNDNFNEVILLIPPSSDYWKIKTQNTNIHRITKDYIKNLKETIVSENFQNIKIWDLHNSPPNFLNNSDFYDSVHLNINGAKKLTVFISNKLLEEFKK